MYTEQEITAGAEAVGYLGWWFRTYWDGELSFPDDETVKLDPARKWDYPMALMSRADTEKLRALLGQIGKLRAEAVALMETYRGQTPDSFGAARVEHYGKSTTGRPPER